MEAVLAELALAATREALRSTVTEFVARRARRPSDKADDERAQKRIQRAVRHAAENTDEGALALHVREASGWASIVHMQGMPRPAQTGTASIALSFSAVPRRFRGGAGNADLLDEAELVTSGMSYLILGDPGSGKTTTIKRLILSLFEESSLSAGNPDLRFPVLIVCRDVDWSHTDLTREICHRVGIDLDAIHREVALDEASRIGLAGAALDALQALLVVDGIDEIPDPDGRAAVLRVLERLQRLVGDARLICSCRSGDAPHLEGYATAELLPLSRQQIADIIAAQSSAPEQFLEQVARSAATDLLDRPLFLTQLLLVFETTGSLPDRPVDLYRQLVRLLLHDWDEQRSIKRRSRYSTFDASAKQDFLAEIAFRLTRYGKARFTEDDLLSIYDGLATQFGLEERHAKRVVREIESHAGLIADVPGGFEFTHFTLQEYLCADSIVRQGITDEVKDYLRLYPEVIAVAIALSSRPNHFLQACVGFSRRFDSPRHASAFGRRLGAERPRFVTDEALGDSILHLLAHSDSRDAESWRRLGEIESVRDSLQLAASKYHVEVAEELVRFYPLNSSDRGHQRSARISVPTKVMALYVDDLGRIGEMDEDDD